MISAKLSLANGSGTPADEGHAVRPRFGALMPRAGSSLALISTGHAAGKNDTNPSYQDFQNTPSISGNGTSSAFPADFLLANDGALPNAPGCPGSGATIANDPVMLTLEVRVPSNAHSFSLKTNFYSAEFPEWTCSPYNDFFVVLLDSMYQGTSPNPTDKNLAFYTPPNSMMKYPVGVNLAANDTGLFTQCKNGGIGCAVFGTKSISTCT